PLTWWTSNTSPARWIFAWPSTVLSHAASFPSARASNVFASLTRGQRSTVRSWGAPSERKRSRSVRFARVTAAPDDAPAGAQRTPRGFHAASHFGAAPSTPTTAMSGFGPKSQSHAAVSARTSGSASGRQEASAGGSSSTNRSYATWLTCIFNLWVSREAGRGTSPRTRGERPSTKVPADLRPSGEGVDRAHRGAHRRGS